MCTASNQGVSLVWCEGVLDNCSFEYCTLVFMVVVLVLIKWFLTDCSFEYCSAIKNGAAIYYVNSGSVDNSNFTKNTANWNGAIFINSGSLNVSLGLFLLIT